MNEQEVAAMMAEQNKLIDQAEAQNQKLAQRTEVNMVPESKLLDQAQ